MSQALRRHAPAAPPRLLTKSEAAAYCGMSTTVFDRVCPVRALRFSERMVKFDRADIDAWIEAMKGGPAAATGEPDWLARMDHGQG